MPLLRQKLHSSVFIWEPFPAKKEIRLLCDLTHQLNFYRADVSGALTAFVLVLRLELVRSDTDAFDLYIGQEPVPNYFGDVDGSADASAACFYADFFCAAMEESDDCEDVVHDWFFAD